MGDEKPEFVTILGIVDLWDEVRIPHNPQSRTNDLESQYK